MVVKGTRRLHRRKRKESDNMDQFAQSMSVILTRMLVQAERLEDCIKKDNKQVALIEVDALMGQIGQMLEAFSHQIK